MFKFFKHTPFRGEKIGHVIAKVFYFLIKKPSPPPPPPKADRRWENVEKNVGSQPVCRESLCCVSRALKLVIGPEIGPFVRILGRSDGQATPTAPSQNTR
jgi:hypothetical protein